MATMLRAKVRWCHVDQCEIETTILSEKESDKHVTRERQVSHLNHSAFHEIF